MKIKLMTPPGKRGSHYFWVVNYYRPLQRLEPTDRTMKRIAKDIQRQIYTINAEVSR